MILANSSEKSFQVGSDTLFWCILRLFSSVQFSRSVVSDSLRLRLLQRKKYFKFWDEYETQRGWVEVGAKPCGPL